MLGIIQARLGSRRFPRKVLADLDGRALLAHVVERVQSVVDVCVVATVPSDVAELAAALPPRTNVLAFQGIHDDDVLERFVRVAQCYPQQVELMRVTGDCPAWSPEEARRVRLAFAATPGCEYASNLAPGYLDGHDVEIFTTETLRRANRAVDVTLEDREHVTPWMRRRCAVTATVDPGGGSTMSRPKYSVDTPDDLDRLRQARATHTGPFAHPQ